MPFKVVCAHSHLYDFETASLIEGLKNLGIAVYADHESNGAEKIDISDVVPDLYIEFANRAVNTELVNHLSRENKKKLVYVNGEDLQDDSHYNRYWDCFRYASDYGIYFRREFYRGKVSGNEFPLQFAAMDEYFHYPNDMKDGTIVFPSAGEYDNRKMIIDYIELNCLPIEVGRIGHFRHSVKPGDRSRYYNRLSSATAVISSFGWGEDTARFWEAAASGACVISERFNIEMPFPYEHMKNVIFFDHPSEIVDIATKIEHGEIDASKIGSACKEHTERYHTTTARAKYFLDVICKNEERLLGMEGYSSVREKIECERINLEL